MAVKIISTEDQIRQVNYFILGKVLKMENHQSENNIWTDLEIEHQGKNKNSVKFRFNDYKLLKYFVTKLSQANFKKVGIKIKYGNTVLILILSLFLSAAFTYKEVSAETGPLCIDEGLLTEQEKNPGYNLLSFPAVSAGDPHILAVSYFNNKINIITRENYVTQYQYSGVPYTVYKTFLNSDDKKEYYNDCIKDRYEVIKVY